MLNFMNLITTLRLYKKMFQFLDIPMEVFRGEGAGCLQFTLKRFRKIKCVYMYVACVSCLSNHPIEINRLFTVFSNVICLIRLLWEVTKTLWEHFCDSRTY